MHLALFSSGAATSWSEIRYEDRTAANTFGASEQVPRGARAHIDMSQPLVAQVYNSHMDVEEVCVVRFPLFPAEARLPKADLRCGDERSGKPLQRQLGKRHATYVATNLRALPHSLHLQYVLWVHKPDTTLRRGTSARLFESPVLEALTKTPWWVVPIVWLPVCGKLWLPYMSSPSTTIWGSVAIFSSGLLLWTFVEYFLHRFVFHLDRHLPVGSRLARTVHFLTHGVHHKVPMDSQRLVMPPALAAVLIAIVYGVLRTFVPETLFGGSAGWHAHFGSGLFGYVLYDMMHYAEHHVKCTPASYMGRMKHIHMQHHWAGYATRGYGASCTVYRQWSYMAAMNLQLVTICNLH